MNRVVFRGLEVNDPAPRASETELAALESLAGAPLPPVFREFLLSAAGGTLDYSVDVRHAGGVTPLCFYNLYAVKPRFSARSRAPRVIAEEILAERREKGIPEGYVPFASGGGSTIAYLDLMPGGDGRVVAWAEGLGAWESFAGEPPIVEVAPTFDDYLSRLYMNLEEERPHGE